MGIEFDTREYSPIAHFLLDKGIDTVRLMSNNPLKIQALEEAGITVIRIPLVVGVTESNIDYLRTKRDKAGHLIPSEL